MADRKKQLTEMRDKVKAGRTGWLKVEPDFFDEKRQMIQFLAGTKRQQIELLDKLIAKENQND